MEPWTIPVLRWAGSKRKLLPILADFVPMRYSRYVEPFAGSACLFFALRPESAILGDMNADLMATYFEIRKHPRRLARIIAKMPQSDKFYYSIRSKSPDCLDAINRAARFIYLNRNCFNGLYRINNKGEFNVPKGTRTGSLPSESTFYRCAVALRKAKLVKGDFADTLKYVRSGDFVYLDPPYCDSEQRVFREYSSKPFSERDFDRLVEALKRINSIGAAFLLSYADTAMARKRFNMWSVINVKTQRSIAGFADRRINTSELIVCNRHVEMSIGRRP